MEKRMLRRTSLDETTKLAVARLSGISFFLVATYLAFELNGVDLTSLTFLAGTVGIGLGFGMQNIMSNFISGLIILIERPIAVGDRVEVRGVVGRVGKINLRSTTVITNEAMVLIVPNSEFISSVVTNWSHSDPRMLVKTQVGVAYGTEVEKVREALLEAARETAGVLPDSTPSILLTSFGESAINFEVGVWTLERANSSGVLRSDLNFAILRKFRERGIQMPFPQREVRLLSGKAD
jgi:small-conductance mechanosensitive channel